MRINVIIGLLALTTGLAAQSRPGAESARAFALGGIISVVDGIDALYLNPASLIGLEHASVHAGSARSFGISPLSSACTGLAFPAGTDNVVFFSIGQFGYSAYQERHVSAGYAMQLDESLGAAIRFDLNQYVIEGYGNAFLPGFVLGIQFRPVRNMSIGFVAHDPVQVVTHDAITLPTRLSMGIAFRPSSRAGIYLEVDKDIDYAPRLKIGAEYSVAEALTLRVGGAGNPGMLYSGVGLRVSPAFRIDLAAGYHLFLGFTPVIGLTYGSGN